MGSGARGWLGLAAGVSLTAIAGGLAYGRYGLPDVLPLPAALTGERRVVQRRAGPLSYYVAGSGAPILLVHSVNAAASAYEIGPIFDALRSGRRVYALDLPGFGFSDRSDRRYDVALFTDAIHDMLDEIAADSGEGSVDALALSLSSEFLARAATERPAAFRSLTLVTPTGFDKRSGTRSGRPGETREVPVLYDALRLPVWKRALYKLLVTRPSIRFFLEKTWGSPRIDEGSFRYAYLTSHQPGAENAPYAFVSGRLFAADIRNVYERLQTPVLVLHGTRGDFQDFSSVDWTRGRSNWRVIAFDTGALPQFEVIEAFMARLDEFLGSPPERAGQGSSASPSRSPRP